MRGLYSRSDHVFAGFTTGVVEIGYSFINWHECFVLDCYERNGSGECARGKATKEYRPHMANLRR